MVVANSSVSSAQSGAENAGNNAGRTGIESSLSINRGEGSIGVENSFGVTKNSQIKEIRNSMGVKNDIARRMPAEVLKKIVEYRRIADEMISKEPAADGWWSSYNLCTDLSGKWLPELEKRGMKVTFSATDSNAVRANVIVNGLEQQAYKFHVFLTDSSFGTGENEIIFDPTYMQFLEGADKLKGLPKIFIGTHSDAEKLFARFKKNCRVEAGEGGDPLTGKYEIKSFTELIYSYGRSAAARQSF
jgi:hypothetical protein